MDDLVGGQCFAPLPGGAQPSDVPRTSTPTDSFDDLLSSIDVGHGRVASGVNSGGPTDVPHDVSDELQKHAVDGAAAVIPFVPQVIPAAPQRLDAPSPNSDLGQSPTPEIGGPRGETASWIRHEPSARIDRLPATALPGEEVNTQDSPASIRTIAPARDGESTVWNGTADVTASRVWTFLPASKVRPEEPSSTNSGQFEIAAEEAGSQAGNLTQGASSEPPVQLQSGVPLMMSTGESGGQPLPAGAAAQLQRIPAFQTSNPLDGGRVGADEGIDESAARGRIESARSSGTGETVSELPDADVLMHQVHSAAVQVIDADGPAKSERVARDESSLGAAGDVDAAATGSALPASGDGNLLSEPETPQTNVVQQIGEAVEAWRDALQDQGTARFSAWLTPPELGNVWVELTRNADGLTARLMASDDSVQSLLETQAPELRQALSESGITVTELDLSGRPAGDFSSGHRQQSSQHHSEPEPATALNVVPPSRGRTSTRASAVDVRA